jgi:hypothetical protein
MLVLEDTGHSITHIQNDVGVDASRSEVRAVSVFITKSVKRFSRKDAKKGRKGPRGEQRKRDI